MALDSFAGKTAVVTGAASGIGRSLAETALKESMSVCLADIEPGALAETHRALSDLAGPGQKVIAVETDVSDAASVQNLADRAFAELGQVHLLCSNAGVAAGGLDDETLDDWHWVMGVNLYGAVHCLRAFLPRMRAASEASHIVITGSTAGLLSMAGGGGPYGCSKHAVVALAESTYHQLEGTNTGISVLCPGFTATRILESGRNRPGPYPATPKDPEAQKAFEELKQYMASEGLPPSEVAATVMSAVKDGKFWILSHPEYAQAVMDRAESVAKGAPPPTPVH